MDYDRLNHSFAVANKMVKIGKTKKLAQEQLDELFLLGFLHDIGYQYGTNENHNVVGANLLKAKKYKYWKEVYYHGVPNSQYKSFYLDILNTADMTVDKYGNDVGFEERLEDIKSRYGENSIQYFNSYKLIDELKNRK